LPPKAVRELKEEKQKELDALVEQMRRPALALAHTQAGFIARSCLADVARAVAALLPGVSVDVEETGEAGLRVGWE